MLVLLIMVILILMVAIVLLFNWDEVFKQVSEFKKKVGRIIHKLFRPLCKVVLYVKNFFGRIIKYAGR